MACEKLSAPVFEYFVQFYDYSFHLSTPPLTQPNILRSKHFMGQPILYLKHAWLDSRIVKHLCFLIIFEHADLSRPDTLPILFNCFMLSALCKRVTSKIVSWLCFKAGNRDVKLRKCLESESVQREWK